MTFMKNVANSFSFLNLTFFGGGGGGGAGNLKYLLTCLKFSSKNIKIAMRYAKKSIFYHIFPMSTFSDLIYDFVLIVCSNLLNCNLEFLNLIENVIIEV